MSHKLVFVYNANTDPVSVIVDYAHKVFKPSTYKCELCELTHHNLGQRSAWKKFKKRSKVEMEFKYIRGFEAEFNLQYEYPVILERTADGFHQIMGKKEFQKIESVEELIEKLEVIIEQV
ncbi:MAG: GTPase [Crocinitomicaceae bacterium]|nr:GTPase [Crocinitomicaceae bacterium]